MDIDNADTPDEIEVDPKGVVRRWLLELKLADKREKDWRDKGVKIWDRYRQKQTRKHSFNILWSNTETLRPAVYNSLPAPDVRRRYPDADPLGKACSEVLARSLEYGLDTTDFDHQIKSVVLDALLPGRGIARVRYVPSLRQVGVTAAEHDEDEEQHEEGGEALEGQSEEVDWEQAPIEQVAWDKFRMGLGKTWGEVPWISFEHKFTRDQLVDKFGDIGKLIPLDNVDDDDVKAERDEQTAEAFKTAKVYEIWDKEEREVLFIAPGYKESPVQTLDDPLRLTEFWPIPRPLYAIEDSDSLVPTSLYAQYQEQAEELDNVTRRINVLIKGLKMRGIYDATLTELSELMRGEDNDLIPAQNVTALLERGGLEKAIWFMPIEQAARVLQILQLQREATKQVIYEITGISDIIRGTSNAQETATAQQIKSNFGTMRLKKMQAEVSRFIRDLMRMQAEIIGEHFQHETLSTMTGLQFPTMEQKQQAMMQYQAQAQQAAMSGQQPPPPPNLPPAWEEICQVLKDDKLRTFKVDVETDSTVSASAEGDLQGLREVLTGLSQIIQGFGPAVQMGAMPVDVVKQLMLTVARRSKMGNAVEDAIDKIQQPPPPQQQQQPVDNSPQVEAAKQQGETQRHQMTLDAELKKHQLTEQAKVQIEQLKQENENLRTQQKVKTESDTAMMQSIMEGQHKQQVANIDGITKVEVAKLKPAPTLQQ